MFYRKISNWDYILFVYSQEEWIYFHFKDLEK